MEIKSTPKLKLFAWKLIHSTLLSRDKLRKIGINVDSDCPICHKDKENMDHIFKDYDFAYNVWITINLICPSSFVTDYAIIDCSECIWGLKISCHVNSLIALWKRILQSIGRYGLIVMRLCLRVTHVTLLYLRKSSLYVLLY